MLKTFWLGLVCALGAGSLSAGSWTPTHIESAAPTSMLVGAPRIEVGGPSVLLNARARGDVQILDLRASGRAVPGARRQYRRNDAPLFVIADESVARRWLRAHNVKSAFVIAPRFIEYEQLRGAAQIEPRDAQEKVAAGWPIFDISEQWEFDHSRLPGSQRLDYAAFRAGETAGLPRDKPFIIACRVGHRSQLVTRELRRRGYDARNLDGGLWQWECDGLEVER